MPLVFKSALQEALVAYTGTAVVANFDFYFKDLVPGRLPQVEGQIGVVFIPTTVAGDTNALTVQVSRIHVLPNALGVDAEHITGAGTVKTLVSALDWTSAQVYGYALEDAIEPCEGIRVSFTFNPATNPSSFNVDVWLKLQ